MKEIQLTQGYATIVDDQDYESLATYKWCVKVQSNTAYAIRTSREDRKQTTLSMHRVILDPPAHMHVDHINGDGLDNRRCNLRLATRAQNMHNRRVSRNSASGIKGVWLNSAAGAKKLWAAAISINGRQIHLGSYDTSEDARAAYCEAAAQLHGEFARTI